MHTSLASRVSFRGIHCPLLLSALLALAGCGGSSAPLGESEQPITAANPDESDSEPLDSDAACALGTPAQGPPPFGASCQSTARGLCFDSDEAACACAGCGKDTCMLAESFPTQAFCQNDEDDGSDPDAPVSDSAGGDDAVSSPPSCGGGTSSSPGSAGGGVAPGQTEPSLPNVPENCDFVALGECFTDGAAACEYAGCAQEECLILESYPAQITCGR